MDITGLKRQQNVTFSSHLVVSPSKVQLNPQDTLPKQIFCIFLRELRAMRGYFSLSSFSFMLKRHSQKFDERVRCGWLILKTVVV